MLLLVPPPSPPPSPRGPLGRFLTNPGGVESELLHHLARALAGLAPWWPALVAGAGALAVVCVAAPLAARARWTRGGHWIEIAPPTTPDPAGGLALWRMAHPLLSTGRTVAGRRPPVAFEYRADGAGTRIWLWAARTLPADSLAAAAHAAWPGARAHVTTPPPPPGGRTSGGRARLVGPDWLALNTGEHGSDPLRGPLSALTHPGHGETVVLQVLASPATGRRLARARRAAWALRRGQPPTGRGLRLPRPSAATTRTSPSVDPVALADVREATGKLTNPPHFEVTVRYTVTGPPGHRRRARRRAHCREIAAALGLYTARNQLVGRRIIFAARSVGRRRTRHGFLLCAAELAALAHLPAEPVSYGLPTAPARAIAPPTEVAHA